MQVLPDAQVVQPVYVCPPHLKINLSTPVEPKCTARETYCPHLATVQPPPPELVVVVVDVLDVLELLELLLPVEPSIAWIVEVYAAFFCTLSSYRSGESYDGKVPST